MAVCTNRSPVVASHPLTGQFVTLVKGAEFRDDDPIVAEQAWAFAPVDEPASVESVRIADVEAAVAAPGQKRTTRRA